MRATKTHAPADTALSVALKRKRAEAIRIKTVEEFYQVKQLGNTQMYRVSHPKDDARSYIVNMYEQECDCTAFRQAIKCKHCKAVQHLIDKGVLQCQQQ